MKTVLNEDEKAVYVALVAIKLKLRAAMMEGPFGDSVIITPTEATLIYRLLFETK